MWHGSCDVWRGDMDWLVSRSCIDNAIMCVCINISIGLRYSVCLYISSLLRSIMESDPSEYYCSSRSSFLLLPLPDPTVPCVAESG